METSRVIAKVALNKDSFPNNTFYVKSITQPETVLFFDMIYFPPQFGFSSTEITSLSNSTHQYIIQFFSVLATLTQARRTVA